MNPNINNEQFVAAPRKAMSRSDKLIALQREYTDGLSADGIDLDEWGNGPDLRGKVMWGLADGSLPVYSSRPKSRSPWEEDDWGTECARCSSTRTRTLLVGDDPEHRLEGTPLCQKHYLEEHGHKMPHYIIHPDDEHGGTPPRKRYIPSGYQYGLRARILDALTPDYHPAVSHYGLPGDMVRRVPRRSLHGSTQRMEVGDIVEPRQPGPGATPAAFSTLDPNVALSYADGIVGNYNSETDTRARGPVNRVYEVEPVDPTEEVDPKNLVTSTEWYGIPHKKGLRVVGVMDADYKGPASRLLRYRMDDPSNRRAALEQGAQEGRS